MNKKTIKKIISRGVPLPLENIDTDQIIPARFLKAVTTEGFGKNLFQDWRFEPDGTPKKSFVLNNPKYSGKILVAGDNFGCGSSREHAAWALVGSGFAAVISSSFSDIFRNNALNNNLLTVQVNPEFLQKIFSEIEKNPKIEIEIDLPKQIISIQGLGESFPIDLYKKKCLMEGYDDIDYILSLKDKIEKFDKNRKNDFSLNF